MRGFDPHLSLEPLLHVWRYYTNLKGCLHLAHNALKFADFNINFRKFSWTDFTTNFPTYWVVIMQKGAQLQGSSPPGFSNLRPLTRGSAQDASGGLCPRTRAHHVPSPNYGPGSASVIRSVILTASMFVNNSQHVQPAQNQDTWRLLSPTLWKERMSKNKSMFYWSVITVQTSHNMRLYYRKQEYPNPTARISGSSSKKIRMLLSFPFPVPLSVQYDAVVYRTVNVVDVITSVTAAHLRAVASTRHVARIILFHVNGAVQAIFVTAETHRTRLWHQHTATVSDIYPPSIQYNTIQYTICRALRSQTSCESGALDGSGPCYFMLS